MKFWEQTDPSAVPVRNKPMPNNPITSWDTAFPSLLPRKDKVTSNSGCVLGYGSTPQNGDTEQEGCDGGVESMERMFFGKDLSYLCVCLSCSKGWDEMGWDWLVGKGGEGNEKRKGRGRKGEAKKEERKRKGKRKGLNYWVWGIHFRWGGESC